MRHDLEATAHGLAVSNERRSRSRAAVSALGFAESNLPRMISPAEAETAIRSHVPRLPSSQLPSTHWSGAVLREPIVASRDQPPFDRVTMDGIAFSMSAIEQGSRRIPHCRHAGRRRAPLVLADTVTLLRSHDGRRAAARLRLRRAGRTDRASKMASPTSTTNAAPPGINIHTRGLDCRAGEPSA